MVVESETQSKFYTFESHKMRLVFKVTITDKSTKSNKIETPYKKRIVII